MVANKQITFLLISPVLMANWFRLFSQSCTEGGGVGRGGLQTPGAHTGNKKPLASPPCGAEDKMGIQQPTSLFGARLLPHFLQTGPRRTWSVPENTFPSSLCETCPCKERLRARQPNELDSGVRRARIRRPKRENILISILFIESYWMNIWSLTKPTPSSLSPLPPVIMHSMKFPTGWKIL